MEKENAVCSRILAWEIQWTGEPGGLQPVGSQKSRTWLSDYTTMCCCLVVVERPTLLEIQDSQPADSKDAKIGREVLQVGLLDG